MLWLQNLSFPLDYSSLLAYTAVDFNPIALKNCMQFWPFWVQ